MEIAVKHFVDEGSIVKKIWGTADTVLFIFAGAAAEFALNKAVDWLYFTGKLPADPLGRLFSTVTYSRRILFSTDNDAYAAIDQINAIHNHVENARGAKIPDWAYLDVLDMLIDYTIRSYELLERKLTDTEKTEVFQIFYKVGTRMNLKGLPATYQDWVIQRGQRLKQNLQYGNLTNDLYQQYRKHLGSPRYWLLKKVQALLVPPTVKQKLGLTGGRLLKPLLFIYKLSGRIKLKHILRDALLPAAYKEQIRGLDTKY
ncbi:DUF2236 domain-containing protein [Mucilaginibacter terrigena]|uniref:DUF2236 domain-containing protein n=1 Tax=Mucilaginibacter terrigena TaxID=2492395 RepID=A0A4Q5LN84_9SPHI|nr:oxygenase MpaB family protein [Mucilaginibacter terrigena]RYU90913.1 DUF2236 domain-containing protein [Mucilaginibacter terrigena]